MFGLRTALATKVGQLGILFISFTVLVDYFIIICFIIYSSSSLFTVSSPNQLFVHVQSPQKSHIDPIYFCINQVLKNSINMDMGKSIVYVLSSQLIC